MALSESEAIISNIGMCVGDSSGVDKSTLGKMSMIMQLPKKNAASVPSHVISSLVC